jgi:SAM-dependent methyltransferase
LRHSFADLGATPLANSFLDENDLLASESFFELHARVCGECFLVQLPELETAEKIFSDYAYFSSYSDSWLSHAKDYVDRMTARFGLNSSSQVIEIASNDGYLLQFFQEKKVPVLGIEPAVNVAQVAEARGIETLIDFFGTRVAHELATKSIQADLLLGNNVLAHVPDLNDFVAGLRTVLKPRGVITMEFPHLLRLMDQNQFDTIYHEHFSYFSLSTVERVFAAHGLALFDVDELATHGGSLRIYACHESDASKNLSPNVSTLIAQEESAGLGNIRRYKEFGNRIRATKRSLLSFLITAKSDGKSIVGYGAAAKGNTLLNFCGVGTDFLDYTVDRSPHKQGKYLPGTRIPIYPPEKLGETKPDYILILPWNLQDEIIEQQSTVRSWGGQFIVPIPEVGLR